MKQFLSWMVSLLITVRVSVPPLVGMGLIMWQVILFINWVTLSCIDYIPDCPLSPGTVPLTVPAVQTELGQDESPDLPPPPDIW